MNQPKQPEDYFNEWFATVGPSLIKLLQTELGRDPEIIKAQMKIIFGAGMQAGNLMAYESINDLLIKR